MKFFSQTTIYLRLALIMVNFLIPIVFLGYMVNHLLIKDIDFADKQIQGIRYAAPLLTLLDEVADFQLSVLERSDLQEGTKAIDELFAQLNDADREYALSLGLIEHENKADRNSPIVADLNAQWAAIKANPDMDRFDGLLRSLSQAVATVGNKSNMILDPDLDSYYLVDIAIGSIPATLEKLASIKSKTFTNLAGNGGVLPESERTPLTVLKDQVISFYFGRIQDAVNTSIEEDAHFYGKTNGLEENLKKNLAVYLDGAGQLQTAIDQIVSGAMMEPDRFIEIADVMHDGSADLGQAVLAELEKLLEIRIENLQSKRLATLAVAAGVALIALILAFLIANGISKSLLRMTTAMTDLSAGNTNVDIPFAGQRNEIGKMAGALAIFKNNAIQANELRQEQERLERRTQEEKKKALKDMADQFDAQVGSRLEALTRAAEQLQSTSNVLAQTANTTMQASASVAGASEESSSNVAAVASATEEMSASAQEISMQVSAVARHSSDAARNAADTSRKVDDLNSLVGNIGEVVSAIKAIAEQTNLLALNATIEAARAGEAGKGFAVVADEVKKLASETAQKTQEIESRITEIQSATQASVMAMQDIIKGVSDIDSMSAGAAGAVEEQNAVLAAITRNIAEVSQATQNVASSILQVRAAADETGQTSTLLKTSANDIAGLSEALDTAFQKFLSEVRGG